jgi:hypothetical protein
MSEKLSYEFVKDFIEKEKYTLLSTSYINNKSKLKLKCPSGHTWSISYNSFNSGCRCLYCSGKKQYSYEFVKKFIEKEGYILLSSTYENSKKKLNMMCDKGHIFEMSFGTFKNANHRCNICSGNQNYNIKQVNEIIEKEGYSLLSNEYKNNKQKLKLKCTNGHVYNTRLDNFQSGQRCPRCYQIKGGSQPEKEITDHIKSIYNGNIIENDRTIVKNYWTGRFLELDIYLPDIKKAIEFGCYYRHNDDYQKWKEMMKIKQCKKQKIDLLVIIYKGSWRKERDKILNDINMFILK